MSYNRHVLSHRKTMWDHCIYSPTTRSLSGAPTFSSSSPVTPPTLAAVRSTAVADAALRAKRAGGTHVTLSHHLPNPYVASALGAATLRHDDTVCNNKAVR
jgi:hypothetical protein